MREDAIALFGFGTPLEQDLFERLIAINGVGPKLALAVLSGIEPAELIRAVRTQDVARLTEIPGVGKKTAERIGLELKDRLPATLPASGRRRPPARRRMQLRDDLLSALLNLGYQRAGRPRRRSTKVLRDTPDAALRGRARDVLRAMMKG